MILVEVILKADGADPFDDTRFYFDLLMLAHTNGRERTEKEWKNILEEAGFPRYRVIALPAITSIIEAYPSWILLFPAYPTNNKFELSANFVQI